VGGGGVITVDKYIQGVQSNTQTVTSGLGPILKVSQQLWPFSRDYTNKETNKQVRQQDAYPANSGSYKYVQHPLPLFNGNISVTNCMLLLLKTTG